MQKMTRSYKLHFIAFKIHQWRCSWNLIQMINLLRCCPPASTGGIYWVSIKTGQQKISAFMVLLQEIQDLFDGSVLFSIVTKFSEFQNSHANRIKNDVASKFEVHWWCTIAIQQGNTTLRIKAYEELLLFSRLS